MSRAEKLLEMTESEAAELLGREDSDVAAELLEQVEPQRSAKLLGLLAPQVGADVVEQMELEYARAIVEQMAPATVTQSAQFKNGSGDPRWRAWQRIWFGVYSV